MNNFLLTAGETINQAELMQELTNIPVWQTIIVGLIASVLFVVVFLAVFMIVSTIIGFIMKCVDKYYEKTGKKRPIKKRRNNRYH